MFWGLGLCYLWAQDGPRQPGASKAVLQRASANANDERDNDRALTQMFKAIIANNRAGGWRKVKERDSARGMQ